MATFLLWPQGLCLRAFSFPSPELRCVSEIDIQILSKQLKLAKGRVQGKTASSCQATVCWGGNCDLLVFGQKAAGGVVGIQRQEIQAATDGTASEAGSEAIL